MEAPPLERKLVAILAADVAGYSRLMGIDEEGTLATLSAFRVVTDNLISRHGGEFAVPPATASLPRSAARWLQSNAQSTSRRNSPSPIKLWKKIVACSFGSESMSATLC